MNLIFDADDTLWENNIYFEEAFDQFCAYLQHSTLSPRQVRDVLDDIERTNAKLHGYGSKNFARNLAECYRHLAEHAIEPAQLQTVEQFAYAILQRPIELMADVPETVATLAARHRLLLFTKGDADEQQLKIDRSGLAPHFSAIAIAREKNPDAYRRLANEHSLDPQITWMIGNSPKSDINPALAVGLNAVFIPHPRTWVLEHEEIVHEDIVHHNGPASAPRLLRISRIADLLELF